MFNRRAGDNEPVKFIATGGNLGKGTVKTIHMRGGCVAGLMLTHSDQAQIDLQRGRADQTRKLNFGLNFLRHQIKQGNPQWSNILPGGLIFIHHHNALSRKRFIGGKCRGKFDRHG